MALTIDHDELAARVEACSPGISVRSVTPLVGGASSLTYVAEVDTAGEARRVVVKVAPPRLDPVRNRDVLRQARVMRALAGAPGVPVPEILFEDAGEPGASSTPPLFVMNHVEGESFEPIIDPLTGPMPDAVEVESRAGSATAALAALHAADPEAIGIAGEPVLGIDDELERWTKSFATVEDGLRSGAAELHDRLAARRPEPELPAVVHGDYRLGNTLCRGGEVHAIIDWEIWSLTDPRIDLAWFLMFTARTEQPTAVRDADGMPDAGSLLARYEEARGRTVSDLGWFHAFVRYKQAATIALIVKRRRRAAAERGEDPGPLSATPRLLLARAAELL